MWRLCARPDRRAATILVMPELPEVETIARDLRGLVIGAVITGARSDWPATLRSHSAEGFAAAVRGRTILGTARRGKQLLIRLSAPAGSAAPAVMTVHLKMTGQIFVVPASAPSDKHVHLTLSFADGRELRFRDIRKFGRVGLYRRDPETGLPVEGEAPNVLAAGAEPLEPEFTAARLRDLLAKRRGRLKTLLLNQDFLAGVGNIYADEALWRARLHPLRDASTLKPSDTARLHAALRDVLTEAVERRGSSVDDYTAPEGDGSMQERLLVYQRAGEPCLRCGRPIKRIVVGGRATHFCSWCQRLPKEQLARMAAGVKPEPKEPPVRASGSKRRGRRWTELSGEGVVGRTRGEETAAGERAAATERAAAERAAADRVRRTEARRKAAAARRAAARAGESA